MPGTADDVEAHLARIPEPQQSTLRALRATLREILPDAQETISYRMPAFVVDGKAVAGYDAFKHHCSYFPHSGNVLGQVSGIPDGWVTSPGTMQFPIDKPPSKALVKRLVKARLAELEARRKR